MFGSLGLFALMFLVFVRLCRSSRCMRFAVCRRGEWRMTDVLLAQFADGERLSERRGAPAAGIIGCLTPLRRSVEDVIALLDHRPSHIKVAMFDRRHSRWRRWPTAPNTTRPSSVIRTIPAAGRSTRGSPSCWCRSQLGSWRPSICGVIAFLIETGLPRLHHPLFGAEGFERVSEDAFVLAIGAAGDRRRPARRLICAVPAPRQSRGRGA